MTSGPEILFANYAVPNCGVHQYGRNLFAALQLSRKFGFEYVEVDSLSQLDEVVAKRSWRAVLANFHPQTMTFLDATMPRRFGCPAIAVMHEMTQQEADQMPRGLFQYYVMGDPTLVENNDYVFSAGRVIPHQETRAILPSRTTIGSMGFSVGSKGFQRLLDLVQEEFDDAVVRINIPPNGIIDADGGVARGQIEACQRRLWKPAVQLQATHQFFDQRGLVEFLASNTMNAFLYDYIPKAGISSAADHAMAARRPFAITRSIMFRHLHDLTPPITIEDTSLRQIIANGTRPYDHLLERWRPENTCQRFEDILAIAIKKGTATASSAPPQPDTEPDTARSAVKRTLVRTLKGARRRALQHVVEPLLAESKARAMGLAVSLHVRRRGGCNRILDDWARAEYAATIERLGQLAPEITAKKIPRANIQQAFIFETVCRFANKLAAPRMLCVGSFEDSAAAALKKVGHVIEEIDPAINQLDLNTFFHLPTTKRGSYDIIFSTSVLEHVKDDAQFVTQIADLLAPGGVAVLTCDFKEGYRVGQPVISGDYRFYTKADLSQRLLDCAADCELVDAPAWDCDAPDFDLGGFKYTFATLTFQKRTTPSFSVAWDKLTLGEQRRFYGENGFLVIPGVLAHAEVTSALADIQRHGLTGTTEDVWSAPSARQMVTNTKLLRVLRTIFGNDLRFFKAAYKASEPEPAAGEQRQPMHVDFAIGEREGDLRNSSASWVNVAFYLTDLTEKHAPLWVVPGSNRNYDIVPGSDLEHLGERAKMVFARAGDAVLFHGNTVHAASRNFSEKTRHAYFLSYRPAWARAHGRGVSWPSSFVDSFPVTDRDLFAD